MIQDATGKGFWAKVTPNNRLMTTGVDLTLTEAATETGDTYNINTGEITLTGTGESALFYIENQEETNLLITDIIVSIKDFTGTAGQPELAIYRNPTNGTIETNGVIAEQTNRNYGSSKKIDANIYQGVEGDTITGHTDRICVYLPSVAAATFNAFSTLVVLPKGAALAISYTPPAGNTSMKVIAAVNATLNGSQL
jgi:hypothetical protein